MAIELEGLEFQIEAQSQEVVKSIDALANSFRRLKTALKGGIGLTASLNQLKQMNEATKDVDTDKVEKLGKALSSLKDAGNVNISSTVPKRIGDIATSLHDLGWSDIEKLEDLGKALRDINDVSNVKIPNVPNSNASSQIVNPATAVAAVTPADSGLQAVSQQVQEATGAMENLGGSSSRLKSILNGIGGVFKKGFSVGVGVLRKLGSAMERVAKAGWKVASFLPKISMSRLVGQIKQTTSSLGQFFSSLKRIAMYRLVRAALSALTQGFKEGISNLYQYSMIMEGQFSKSMDRLATSSQYLKNSLGAMAAPIINALAPAIDFVIDKIVTLLNLINQLIARLSGAATFTAAKKVGKAWGDAAKSAGGAAKKAADEIKRYTLGFDELNILGKNKDDSSGGGGGGSDTDYGSMFEELPIDSSIGDFAERLKEAFENSDWESLGRLLGGKVNEIFDSIPWAEIGTKVGKGIDGFVKTLYYFLDEIDFRNIGSHLAELLNNALENIDFSFVGRLFVRGLTAGLDFFRGLLGTLNWKQVGKSIGDCLRGMFDEAHDWIAGIDWSQAAHNLYQGIKDFVTGIDFASLAKSFFSALGSAFAATIVFIGTFFSDVWSDISAYFSEKIEECGGDIPAGLWKGIKDAFGNVVSWIKENIVDPFVEGFKEVFGIHSPSTVMEELGGFITQGLLNGIAAPFRAIKKWIDKNILTPLKKAFSKGGTLAEFVVGVKDTAEQWWSDVQTWWGNTVGKVKEFTTGVKNQASTWWSNVKNWWSGKVGAVAQFTTSVANQAASWWSDVNTWWNQKVGKVKEFWTWVTNQAGSWWSDVNTWWNGKVGKVKEFTTYVTNQASNWWSSVNSWWNGVVGKVKEFTTNVTNSAATWWSNVKTWWAGKVGAVANFTTNVTNSAATWWSNVKTWWAGKVGSLSVGVSITNAAGTWWSNVKSWWSKAAGTLSTTLSIKVPKVTVTWSSVTVFGKKYSYPSGFGLSWNAKGGILDGAQIFGQIGNTLQVGGEAGKEALLPLERHTEWMDTLAQKVRSSLPGAEGSEELVEAMRQAILEAHARQNDKLDELISEVRMLNDKDTTVEITTNSFTRAMSRKNQRDGKTVIPVST